MRKVKIKLEEDGGFMVEGQDSYPELKGKKLVILTQGHFTGSTQGEEKNTGWEVTGDEAIVMTEEEFHSVKEKLKTSTESKVESIH